MNLIGLCQKAFRPRYPRRTAAGSGRRSWLRANNGFGGVSFLVRAMCSAASVRAMCGSQTCHPKEPRCHPPAHPADTGRTTPSQAGVVAVDRRPRQWMQISLRKLKQRPLRLRLPMSHAWQRAPIRSRHRHRPTFRPRRRYWVLA